MENPGSALRRIVCGSVLLVTLATPPAAPAHYPGGARGIELAQSDGRLPMREVRRLLRYHGTVAIKMTSDTVFIWRDRRWIRVGTRLQGF